MKPYRLPRRHPWTGRRVYVPVIAAMAQVHVPCWCCGWWFPWPGDGASAMEAAYLRHCEGHGLDPSDVPVYVRYGPHAEWDCLIHPSEIVGLIDEGATGRGYAFRFGAAGEIQVREGLRPWKLPHLDGER